MKRVGNIYDKITSFQNLHLAFKKARLGKRDKKEVSEFEFNLEKNLYEIGIKLEHQVFKFSPYKNFQVFEPKRRDIVCAPFKDRVVHHSICNYILPILERSYDTRYLCL